MLFEDRGFDGDYDEAQICANGHVVNDKVHLHPSASHSHCSQCGAATLTRCPECKAPIVGQHADYSGGYEVPSFCASCGRKYPWVARKEEAARALAAELGGLTDAERIELTAAAGALSADAPMTPVEAVRARRLLAKATGPLKELAWKAFIEVSSKAAARVLTGGQ